MGYQLLEGMDVEDDGRPPGEGNLIPIPAFATDPTQSNELLEHERGEGRHWTLMNDPKWHWALLRGERQVTSLLAKDSMRALAEAVLARYYAEEES